MTKPSSSTVADFCERHVISRSFFFKLVREGKLTVTKVGTRTVITDENERAFLASLPTSTRKLAA